VRGEYCRKRGGLRIREKGLGEDNIGEGRDQDRKWWNKIIHTVHWKVERSEKDRGEQRKRGRSVA
jgi:hypothetical protein